MAQNSKNKLKTPPKSRKETYKTPKEVTLLFRSGLLNCLKP